MFKGKKVTAILLLGGIGLRFGSPIPKQFHLLAGKKLYLHPLEVLLAEPALDEIILCCPENTLPLVKRDVAIYQFPFRVIAGGKVRQESSYLSLQACDPSTDIVLLHDGVRPFLSSEILTAHLETAYRHPAVDTCIPSADTIVLSCNGETIEKIPPRHECLRAQTPQSFSFPLLLKAHHTTKQTNATDDCMLMIEAGYPVHIVQGDETNMKITTETDLLLAEQLFSIKTASLRLSPR